MTVKIGDIWIYRESIRALVIDEPVRLEGFDRSVFSCKIYWLHMQRVSWVVIDPISPNWALL